MSNQVSHAYAGIKKDGMGETSWNGQNSSWMEQLGALGSVNSDMAHQNNVSADHLDMPLVA